MNKKYVFSVILTFLATFALVFLSCNNDTIENSITRTSNENNQDQTGLAKVRIPLPQASNARNISLEDAKTYTNFFEVIFRNKANNAYFFAKASINQGYIEASIPPGTYDILLLAGNNSGKTVVALNLYSLLASGYVLDAVIDVSKDNIINLTLDTIDIELIAPSKVLIGDDVDIKIIINTKNPLINNSSNTGFAADFIDYHSSNPYSGRIGIHFWFGTVGGSTGTSVGSFKNNVHTYSFLWTKNVFSNYSVFEYFFPVTSIDLRSSSRWIVADGGNANFGQNFRKIVNFVENADVQININWQE